VAPKYLPRDEVAWFSLPSASDAAVSDRVYLLTVCGADESGRWAHPRNGKSAARHGSKDCSWHGWRTTHQRREIITTARPGPGRPWH
jgi:hypothetical protein